MKKSFKFLSVLISLILVLQTTGIVSVDSAGPGGTGPSTPNFWKKSGTELLVIQESVTDICNSSGGVANDCLSFDGSNSPVLSVFSRTGAVIAVDGDYNQAKITGLKTSDSPSFTGLNIGNTSGIGITETIGANASSGTQGAKISLDNTQSNALVVAEIDLGTSAQDHTGLLINAKGANADQRAITIDIGSGLGSGISFATTSAGAGVAAINFDNFSPIGGGAVFFKDAALYEDVVGKIFDIGFNSKAAVNFTNANASNVFLGTHIVFTEDDLVDDFDLFNFERENASLNLNGSLVSSGSVVLIENTVSQFVGTVTDTVIPLKVLQSAHANASGIIAQFQHGTDNVFEIGHMGSMLKKTADPCSILEEGALFYNDTSNYFCYCDNINDVQMHDPTTACF